MSIALAEAVLNVLPFGLVLEEMSGVPLLMNTHARALFLNDGSLADEALGRAIERLRKTDSQNAVLRTAAGKAYEIWSRIVDSGEQRYRAIFFTDLAHERALSDGHAALADELVHVLRGSLTLMLGYLELAAESPVEAGPFIAQSLRAARRMEDKAAAMVALLSGSIRADDDAFVDGQSMREIIHCACETFAGTNAIDAAVAPEVPPIAAAPADLRVLMMTLISTMIGAAESGARLQVHVVAESQEVCIAVEAARAPVSEDERRLALRSYARSQRQSVFGVGQGLGLARELMLRCAGTLSVETVGQAGLRLCARFPLHPR